VIAGTVFSISLLVFFGLIAVYVIRKVGDVADASRKWMIDNPDRISAIRIQSQEVLGPTALRGGILVALILARVVAQIGVFYVWLAFTLSLFEATRPLTTKLAGFVFTPLSDLAGRIAASLPLAVVAAVSGVALYVLLRFVQLFFEGVARRQTTIPWLPPDLAAPTSVLIRVGVVVTAFVFAAPVVTGDPEGALARTGSVALLAFGLACTPLLATVVLGAVVVYGRRVRIGQFAEIGGRTGRVRAVGLIDVRLLEGDGTEARVPHFLSLVRPTRVFGEKPKLAVRVAVSATAKLRDAQAVLLAAAGALGEKPEAELCELDGGAAIFAVSLSPARETTSGELLLSLGEALSEAGFALARSGS
jgi:small-conductance mechanosensitive channel